MTTDQPVPAVRDPRRRVVAPRSSGFTMVEMMVVSVILLLLAIFGFPALQQMLNRSKLQGSAREISVHLGSSRIAAMRLGRNVVVKPSFSEKRLISFVDDNANFLQDLGEDEISNLTIPGLGGDQAIHLMGPDGVEGTDELPGGALEGLTTVDPDEPSVPNFRVAVFEPDGSVREGGGIRISDGKSPANVFEVRIDPPATARIEILKYVFGDSRGVKHPDTDPGTGSWFGQGGNMWEWY